MIDSIVIPLLKIVILLNAVLVAVTYMVLLERKVIAWVQSRLGPMRVGPYGALQPVADAVKLMIKEDITPTRADKWVFTAAPIIALVPALVVFAVIPFGPSIELSSARRFRSTSQTSTSACCISCRSRRSASTASSSRATRRTANIRCWRACAPRRS